MKKVLVIAPHADDEILGVGGTIAKHIDSGDQVSVAILTGHGEKEHPIYPKSVWEAVRNEARMAMEYLGVAKLIFEEIPAVLVSEEPIYKLNKITSNIIEQVKPEILYVPFIYDLHRDHRDIFHSLNIAWRPCSETGRNISEIHAYEVLSETHWNAPYLEAGFIPITFVDITKYLDTKLKALSFYQSQLKDFPDIRSIKAIKSLAELRGAQIGTNAAEGLVTIRQIK